MKQTNHPKKTKSPITWVPTAYFAMGLPFVVLNMVTVLMFKGLGVEDKLITFWTSLILLPWTLKPLWSPFLELFKTKKFFVITTQLITGVTFGLVAFSLNLPHFFSISIALLAIFAMIFRSRPPFSLRILRISLTSAAVLVKEAAIKSNPS